MLILQILLTEKNVKQKVLISKHRDKNINILKAKSVDEYICLSKKFWHK